MNLLIELVKLNQAETSFPVLLARQGDVPFGTDRTLFDDHDYVSRYHESETHRILLDREELEENHIQQQEQLSKTFKNNVTTLEASTTSLATTVMQHFVSTKNNVSSLGNSIIDVNALSDVRNQLSQQNHSASSIAEALPMSKVTYINLSRNNIGDSGAIALAEALPTSKVTLIYLGDNNIGDSGAIALAQLLRHIPINVLVDRMKMDVLLVSHNLLVQLLQILLVRNVIQIKMNTITNPTTKHVK